MLNIKSKTIIFACLLGLSTTILTAKAESDLASIKTSEVEFSNLKGVNMSLGDLQGKVILLNFWATWCAPCIREIPSMERLYQQKSGDHFEMLAVNSGESAEQIADFIPKLSIQPSFPILLDSQETAYSTFKLKGMPTTFVIDHTGKILHVVAAAKEWDSEEISTSIDELIKAAQAH